MGGGMHPFLVASDGERGLGGEKDTMCFRDRIEMHTWNGSPHYIQCELNEYHPVNNIKTTYDYLFRKRRAKI